MNHFDKSVVVLCGGTGAARFLAGLTKAIPEHNITAIVNVGDDINLHGLHISPDIDTITYTLSDQIDRERGWGLKTESWNAMAMLKHYGGYDWFNLGDRDLGTHMYRTQRLIQGEPLSVITADIARAWQLQLRLLPVTDDRLRTMITTVDEGEIQFQEYFVRHQHQIQVSAVRFAGQEQARPAPGVMAAIESAACLIIAPSNPIVSIDPILAIKEIRQCLTARRDKCIAISPIIAGQALKGPAAQMMSELGIPASALGIANHYNQIAKTLVVDNLDAELSSAIEETGMNVAVTDTIMTDQHKAQKLADFTLKQIV